MTPSFGSESSTPHVLTREHAGRAVGGLTPPTAASGRLLVDQQNDDASMDLLAAKFDRYERATTLMRGGFLLMVSTVLLAVLKPLKPEWSLAVDLYVMVAFFVELLLNQAQESLQSQGAQVQEFFDRRVYQLPWPDGWVEKPTAETIALWAPQGRSRASHDEQARWRNWYPVEVAFLPLSLARLACQRANAWWDVDQRHDYATALIGASAFILTVLAVAAIVPDFARETVKDNVVVWLPLPYWLMREGLRHRRAARERRCALDRAKAAADEALASGVDEATLTRHAEQIQAALFQQREAGPMVWPWFYRRRRSRSEAAMKVGATDAVAQYRGRYSSAH